MGSGTQILWSGLSGSLLVSRSSETTARPLASVQTTGGLYTVPAVPAPPIVPGEEQEWASLLVSERKSLVKRRIKPGAVNKAIRQLRYDR